MAAPRTFRIATPVVVVVLIAATLIALLILNRTATPGDASPEAGFARDMAIHHSQAVEMAFIVRDASEDEQIRQLAYDIIVTQTAQRGIFMGWLQQWGLDQSSARPPMAWMADHPHAAAATPVPGSKYGAMPGMASEEELNRLRGLKGKDAEILFLQLMIRHHEGGVDMADGLLALGDREEVLTMARHISTGQAGEITLMTEMLEARGAKPFPSILKKPAASSSPQN